MDYYLAIDIGSTSGRHMVGWYENEKINVHEVYRFSNGPAKENGHLIWNLEHLFNEVVCGIRQAFAQYPHIRSLSVDTWGGDYVLMNGDKEILPCYTYRDFRTEDAVKKVHEIIPFEKIYQKVGYQYGPYNTIYQLYSDKMNGRLEHATDFLMMPEYLLYRLSGIKLKEKTNNSTTSLVDPRTKQFDQALIQLLGYPEHLFPPLHSPGILMGPLLPEIARQVGGSCDVVLCATHDTQSAISAIPMEEHQLYISSGTWSLLGIRLDQPLLSWEGAKAGFSNEAGLDYICYLTNIAGMWIVEQLRRELCPGKDYNTIVKEAEESNYKCLIPPNHPLFLAPDSMSQAIQQYLIENGHIPPQHTGDFFSCAYHSLAASYNSSIKALEKVTNQTYQKIYITGGGAKNSLLNRLTEEYTGKQVIPFPIEASTVGNIMFQIKAVRSSI